MIIIWNIIYSTTKQSGGKVSIEQFKVKLDFDKENAVTFDKEEQKITVKVHRGTGKGDLKAIKFIFKTETNQEIIERAPPTYILPEELETKPYTFDQGDFTPLENINDISTITKVSFVPMFEDENNDELYGMETDEEEVSDGSCNPTDTRSCGLGVCAGIQTCEAEGSWSSCEEGGISSTEICTGNSDEDCDGKTDCNDEDCTGNFNCIEKICDDGQDNDNNKLKDCEDSNCDGKFCNGGICKEGSCVVPEDCYELIQTGYGICTCEDLQDISKDTNVNYELLNNIDCSMTNPDDPDFDSEGTWNDKLGFKPIGQFKGDLNGNNHIIKDLYSEQSSYLWYQGLFTTIASPGKVRNLGLVDINLIISTPKVGGLAGRVGSGAEITQVYVTGTISGGAQPGGLVGENQGTISNCYSKVNINSGSTIGGLVGFNYGGTITNSYATGSVTGTHYSIGGLVGANNYNAIIHKSPIMTNSYATGSVNGDSNIGGLIGSGTSPTNSYWFDNEGDNADYCIGPASNCTGKAENINEFYSQDHDVYAQGTTDKWDFTPNTGIWQAQTNDFPIFQWQ